MRCAILLLLVFSLSCAPDPPAPAPRSDEAAMLRARLAKREAELENARQTIRELHAQRASAVGPVERSGGQAPAPVATGEVPVVHQSRTEWQRLEEQQRKTRKPELIVAPEIRTFCAHAGDEKKIALCERQQHEAKLQLEVWDPHAIGAAGFDIIRRECSAQWRDDYKRRLSCEKQKAAVYKKVNQRS
jgi:hypothetical protein